MAGKRGVGVKVEGGLTAGSPLDGEPVIRGVVHFDVRAATEFKNNCCYF